MIPDLTADLSPIATRNKKLWGLIIYIGDILHSMSPADQSEWLKNMLESLEGEIPTVRAQIYAILDEYEKKGGWR